MCDLIASPTFMSHTLEEYMADRDMQSKITSINAVRVKDQAVLLFNFDPQNSNPIISDMDEDALAQNVYYGYAFVGKKFDKYFISDLHIGNYNYGIDSQGASMTSIANKSRQNCFGKLLDAQVKKIEFYYTDKLLATIVIQDFDVYFVQLETAEVDIELRFYDENNEQLYN